MVIAQMVTATGSPLLWEPVLKVWLLQSGFVKCLAQTDMSVPQSGQSCALAG